MSVLVSVIIPVFNSSEFLCDCLDSILSQSYCNFEIILIDDGSTDDSPQICKTYIQKDNRVFYHRKNNGGASSARNYGLSLARGEYIMFLDSDDFWNSPVVLENLILILENNLNCDFLIFNGSYFFPSTNELKTMFLYSANINKLSDKNKRFESLVRTNSVNMSPGMKLIKRKFLLDNKISFIEGIINEDIPWFLSMIRHCSDFYVVNDTYYCYRREVKSSVTASLDFKKLNDCLFVIESECASINSYEECLKSSVLSFISYSYIILLGNTFLLSNREERDELFNNLRKYDWLLEGSFHPRTQKIARMNKLLGLKITSIVLSLYLKFK